MGLAQDILDNGLIYRVVDDVRSLYPVLIFGTAREEISGRPLKVAFRVWTDTKGLQIKTMEDGLYALSGYPEKIFADFATTTHTVLLTIQADGYHERTVSVIVPATTSSPVQAPDAVLRPLPLRLQGRVVSAAGAFPPIAGARVTSVDDPNPPVPLTEHALLLRQIIQFAHPVNTAVRVRSLAASGTAKQLAEAAGASDLTVTLSDRSGLGAGNILQIGNNETARLRTITSLAPLPVNPALPGTVTLSGTLGATYSVATTVQPMTVGAPGTIAHMTRDADVGDGVLMLDTLVTDEAVEINDPSALEYAAVGAITGSNGYYQADGIGRTRTLFLSAAKSGFKPMPYPTAWAIAYGQPVGVVDFRLAT